MTSCSLADALEGRRVRLSDADLLGVGGEARVYRGPGGLGLALEVFHAPDALARPLGTSGTERPAHAVLVLGCERGGDAWPAARASWRRGRAYAAVAFATRTPKSSTRYTME